MKKPKKNALILVFHFQERVQDVISGRIRQQPLKPTEVSKMRPLKKFFNPSLNSLHHFLFLRVHNFSSWIVQKLRFTPKLDFFS